jgi:hypothetical protein
MPGLPSSRHPRAAACGSWLSTAHLPSALELGENSLADSVLFRNDTPLPMWLCGTPGGGWVS